MRCKCCNVLLKNPNEVEYETIMCSTCLWFSSEEYLAQSETPTEEENYIEIIKRRHFGNE